MKFSGKNVLITGASRGIGSQVARVLADFGLKVWINYKNSAKEADLLCEEILKKGQKAAVIKFDVTKEDEFSDAIDLILQSDNEFSYLVNNAGITLDKLAIRMKTDEFNQVIQANLTSAFIGCRSALKIMSKKRFGSIVNVSSVVGQMGNAGQSNYAASKGGLIAMTKSFALEGSTRNIRFNAVTPGFIQTDMTNILSDDIKEQYYSKIPLKRFGKPDEVAYSIAFLLSDYSGYITGEVLKINGGIYM